MIPILECLGPARDRRLVGGNPDASRPWQNEFGTLFGPAESPPLTGQHDPNGLAWTIPLVPLLDIPTMGMLPWWVVFALNTVLCLVDERRLERAGHSAHFRRLGVSRAGVPVCQGLTHEAAAGLRVRWILCFVGSILLVAAMQAG
jgi:hypothetical protein